MEMLNILENEYIAFVLIPILIGVLNVIKGSDLIPVKMIPLVSLVLGILLGIIFTGFAIKEGIIAGLFIGLSAVGMYSGTTNVIEGINKIRAARK